MSADSQRLKSALRRIVLESPELRELLGDSDNRGDQAGASGVGTSEAEESRLCCDGSTSDNANPGTEERDPDADGAGQDGLDSSDPADLASGDGTLSGVTDCATGEPICFDGSGFIPPDGWDDIDSQPYIEGYQEGIFYALSCRISFVYQIDYYDTGLFYSESDAQTALDEGGCSNNLGRIVTCDCSNLSGGCSNVNDKYGGDGCDPPQSEIQELEWPSDGCTNLIIKDGAIVGSKYDPENDGSYSAPMTEIQLCSGSDQIGLKPAANGGWKTINATTDSGYLWDSHGKKIAHIDGNEYSDPDV